MSNFIAPTGYVELDNDCQYSIDRKSTRSRESVNPDDIAFYFNTYLVPKYGLNNLNVSNVASFMKDLEMNWTKLTPDLKDRVMDIMVDNILSTGDYNFKNSLLSKLNINVPIVSTPVSAGTSFFGSDEASNGLLYASLFLVVLAVALYGYTKGWFK